VNEVFDEIYNNLTCTYSLFGITLKPRTPIQLTRELNFSLSLAYGDDVSNNDIFISGISGIDVYPWPAFHSYGPKSSTKTLHLTFSTVKFYVNNTPPGTYNCDPDLIPDDSSKSVSFFSTYLDSISIESGNTYGSMSHAECPFLFKNTQLNNFDFEYQVDSFLFISLLRFQEVNLTKIMSINSNISQVDIDGYNYKLDEGLLHPLVFEKITWLKVVSTIQSIQPDMFKHFRFLKNFMIQLDSLGNFYHQIGIEWMSYLNINSNVMLYDNNDPDFDWDFLYTYPDRDFCIFAKFPVDRNIHLTLDKTNVTSFTFAWLCKAGSMDAKDNPSCNQTANWTIINGLVKSCDLQINESSQKQALDDNHLYTDWYQTRLIKMLFIEIFPFVLIPCICLIGLFLNWIIIQTININTKKDLKEDFYKYMSANAKFNCL
jgi:hypothetical protein